MDLVEGGSVLWSITPTPAHQLLHLNGHWPILDLRKQTVNLRNKGRKKKGKLCVCKMRSCERGKKAEKTKEWKRETQTERKREKRKERERV